MRGDFDEDEELEDDDLDDGEEPDDDEPELEDLQPVVTR